MFPAQVAQNENFSILRYGRVQLSSDLLELETLMALETEVAFTGTAGSDVLQIPQLNRPIRRIRMRFNPKAVLTAVNTVSGNRVLIPLHIIQMRTQSSKAITYDGTGIINECFSDRFSKEFFRLISEVKFTSVFSDLLFSSSYDLSNFAPNAQFDFNYVAPTAQSFLFLTPEFLIEF